jgi:hypothetical protein
MKRKGLFWGMTVLALTFGLVLVSCNSDIHHIMTDDTTDDDSGGNGASRVSAITLTLNTWANGAITANGEQWFKFTATAADQYIHFAPGTLTQVDVQLYNSAGNAMGSYDILSSSTRYVNKSVTSGSVYYIKVWPYSSSYSGTYKMGFNTSTTPPS